MAYGFSSPYSKKSSLVVGCSTQIGNTQDPMTKSTLSLSNVLLSPKLKSIMSGAKLEDDMILLSNIPLIYLC